MGLYFSKIYFIELLCEGAHFWGDLRPGKNGMEKM